MSEIEQLSDREAITAVHALVIQWCEARGAEPLVAWQAIGRAIGDNKLPSAIAGDSEDDPATAVVCRKILDVVANGEDPNARRWSTGAISVARQPKGHIFDPISLSIIGATAIGLVLAARVKRISNVEFYKGLPEDTDKIVGAVIKTMAGLPPG